MNGHIVLFLSVVVCFFLFDVPVLGQGAAVLQKHGTGKRIYYTPGDEIRFSLQGEDHFRKDHIIAVIDSGFQFHYHFIGYEEIRTVDIRGKRWGSFDWNSAGLKVQIVGVGYIAIDTFNKTVVQGNTFEFDNTLWITGGSIFLAGTLMRFLKPRKIRTGGKYGFVYLEVPD